MDVTPNTPDAAGLDEDDAQTADGRRPVYTIYGKRLTLLKESIDWSEFDVDGVVMVVGSKAAILQNYRSVADIVATLDKMYTTKKPFRMPQNGCHQHMTYVDGCRDCKLRYPYYVPEPVDDNPYNPILNKIIDDLRQALNLPSAGTGDADSKGIES